MLLGEIDDCIESSYMVLYAWVKRMGNGLASAVEKGDIWMGIG